MDEAEKRKALRHDRHTVSLLTDHMVFSPKYRGKVLTGDIALITENHPQNLQRTGHKNNINRGKP